MFKNLNLETKEKENLKGQVKDNAGYLINELYYVYEERYSEEKKV